MKIVGALVFLLVMIQVNAAEINNTWAGAKFKLDLIPLDLFQFIQNQSEVSKIEKAKLPDLSDLIPDHPKRKINKPMNETRPEPLDNKSLQIENSTTSADMDSTTSTDMEDKIQKLMQEENQEDISSIFTGGHLRLEKKRLPQSTTNYWQEITDNWKNMTPVAPTIDPETEVLSVEDGPEEYEFQLKLPLPKKLNEAQSNETITLNGKKTENSVSFEFLNNSATDQMTIVIEETLRRLYAKEAKRTEYHWVLGAIYLLEPLFQSCPEFNRRREEMRAIQVDITTSNRAENSYSAYECEWVEETESKTFYFFGAQSTSREKIQRSMSLKDCRHQILTNTSPRGDKLTQIRWDRNGTTKVAEAEFYWPITHTVTVQNFYINSYNLTVDPTSGTVIVPGVNFKKPCHYSAEKCETSKGLLTWTGSSYFTTETQNCRAKVQETECFQTRQSLFCPNAQLYITSIYSEFKCGRLISYTRGISTAKYAMQAARDFYRGDRVRYSGEFSHLWDSMNAIDSGAIFYQLGLCIIQEDRSSDLITDQYKEARDQELSRIEKLERDKFDQLGSQGAANQQNRTRRLVPRH